MAAGSAIRGSRVGAGPMGEEERGESAPRQVVNYFCAQGHVTSPMFALGEGNEAPEIPLEWDCPKCGFPAGLDQDNPPEPMSNQPFKTHLAYVKERRTEEEGEALLNEALDSLRSRRTPASVAD